MKSFVAAGGSCSGGRSSRCNNSACIGNLTKTFQRPFSPALRLHVALMQNETTHYISNVSLLLLGLSSPSTVLAAWIYLAQVRLLHFCPRRSQLPPSIFITFYDGSYRRRPCLDCCLRYQIILVNYLELFRGERILLLSSTNDSKLSIEYIEDVFIKSIFF